MLHEYTDKGKILQAGVSLCVAQTFVSPMEEVVEKYDAIVRSLNENSAVHRPGSLKERNIFLGRGASEGVD